MNKVELGSKHVNTPLMLAARSKKGILQMLLQAGADVNKTNNQGLSAIMYASRNGNSACVDALIKAGADVNKTNNEGLSATMYASRCGNSACVDALIKAGADVNSVNSRGETALFVTTKIYEEILGRATKGPLQRTMDYRTCVLLLIEAGADVNKRDHGGRNVLYPALMTDDIYCIKSVLRAGVHVNQKDNLGYSALRNYTINHKSKDQAHVGIIIGVAMIAGEGIEIQGIMKRKHYKKLMKSDFCLQHLCRDVIRKEMALAAPRVNLFCKVPQLPLPSRLKRFLLLGSDLC